MYCGKGMPLCATCHRMGNQSQHSGNERAFWDGVGIDPLKDALLLYAHTGDREMAIRIYHHR